MALAQLMKKDRKKNKTLKVALTKEFQRSEKLAQDLSMMHEQMMKLHEDLKEKDKRIVKTMSDYMTTYEALLKLKNEKEGGSGKLAKKKKDKKKDKGNLKDIFDELIDGKAITVPRTPISNPEMMKNPSHDVKKPLSFFNLSGGRKESSSDSDDALRELEEENKRLQSLLEYKDYELNNKKDTDFGYDCFADLREKFDRSLKEVEDKNEKLRLEAKQKDNIITQLQIELRAKDDEISKIEGKYTIILEQQQIDHKSKLAQLKSQLSTHSKEIVDEYQAKIEELKVD